jgi:thiamine-phosphate pyrophosphorylase
MDAGGHDVRNDLARESLARAAACLNRKRDRSLPSLVFLTDDERTPDPLPAVRALPRGSMVILRARRRPRRVVLADAIARIAGERRLLWLVADDPELARRAGADGVHFPEVRIGEAHHWRAIRPGWFITCAAHSLGACARISRAGANAALLAPVFPTESHADGRALGPLRTRFIASHSPVAVYALGGVDSHTAGRLQGARLAGFAAVGALAI